MQDSRKSVMRRPIRGAASSRVSKMRMPSFSGCEIVRVKPGNDGSLSIDALDPCDHGLGAQLGDDSAEMLQVIDLEIDGEFGEIRRAPATC